jgi:hypothetical protein
MKLKERDKSEPEYLPKPNQMDDLFVKGTHVLPTVSFSAAGDLKISGRAIPEDAVEFFKPLLDWARSFSCNSIRLEINLDYFNTSASKQLLNLFRVIEKNPENKEVTMIWVYEEGDEEMLESGELYRELLPGFRFEFRKYSEPSAN